MAGEGHRRRLRALLRLAGVRSAGDGLAVVENAFVHESYSKERGVPSYERMEFLGDSVLGAITASWLYERFPQETEGVLTLLKAAIVNDAQLARTARRLGFSDLLQLGAGMRSAGGADNASILADAFEAFVAALFLGYGLEKARRFVVAEHVERLDLALGALLDSKTRLQHYAQEHLAATPVYRDASRGTPQQPEFTSRVTVKGKTLGKGSGPSKKAAQQAAAAAALTTLEHDMTGP
jgi:ribonuclease-3